MRGVFRPLPFMYPKLLCLSVERLFLPPEMERVLHVAAMSISMKYASTRHICSPCSAAIHGPMGVNFCWCVDQVCDCPDKPNVMLLYRQG